VYFQVLISILFLFLMTNTNIQWLDMLDTVGAFELSEASLLLGLATGPLLSGGVAMSVGGG
jgi:hypothetical protein